MRLPPFSTLATAPAPRLDHLALGIATELRGRIDAAGTLDELDRLGGELATAVAAARARTPEEETAVCAELLADTYGFEGDEEEYDHPDNSMLDLVVARRVGLPILVSAVYVEVARRAGVKLAGIGLPGHFVVGHFGADPPLLLDPFDGGCRVDGEVGREHLRAWTAHETAMRMLNNLIGSYERRGDIARAIRAAELRLALPSAPSFRSELELGLKSIRARLN